ncbi:MAG: hypothetical protein G01um101466_250 [Parcubacteria group bacterium Gr01-1014_66]|nr:MAG: hypothetical protein G01um101466_250 [Parcubacteria group bacterium Gr01-1014_66]
MTTKIGFFGYDAVANNLKTLEEVAKSRGYETVLFPPQIRGSAKNRIHEMYDCTQVVVNLSSFTTKEELEPVDLLLKHDSQKKIVVWEDLPRSALRPKARDYPVGNEGKKFPEAVAAVIAAQAFVIPELYAFGYQRVEVFVPPHWGRLYQEMKEAEENREALRQLLFKKRIGQEPEPVSEEDVIVYVSGSKTPLLVNHAIAAAIQAGKNAFGIDLVFGFGRHPGEKPERPEDEEFFKYAFEKRAEMFRDPNLSMLEAPKELNDTKKIAISDFVILNGGPNSSIIAAYCRKAETIYYWDAHGRKALIDQGVPGGKWFVAEPAMQGAWFIDGTAGDRGAQQMECAFHFLSTQAGKLARRALQEKHFPFPDTWDTASRIIQFLEGL